MLMAVSRKVVDRCRDVIYRRAAAVILLFEMYECIMEMRPTGHIDLVLDNYYIVNSFKYCIKF